MAGYFGFSKSNNAIEAESRHYYTFSYINRKFFGGKLRKKFFDEIMGDAQEYHHTSCRYNFTGYYNILQVFWERRRLRSTIQKKYKKEYYISCWCLYTYDDPRKWRDEMKISTRIYEHNRIDPQEFLRMLNGARERIVLERNDAQIKYDSTESKKEKYLRSKTIAKCNNMLAAITEIENEIRKYFGNIMC